jgi:hypothetical protein
MVSCVDLKRSQVRNGLFVKRKKETSTIAATEFVQSRAINFGRQGHSLTQSKMLHCKTVVNIITYHHVVINCHFFDMGIIRLGNYCHFTKKLITLFQNGNC